MGEHDLSVASVFEDPGPALRVATDAERARIMESSRTGDPGLDAVLRATIAASLGYDWEVLAALDPIASRLPENLKDYVALLRGGAAVELGRYDLAAAARAGVSRGD